MNTYQKIIVPIQGMHCKSCEILIEDELQNISEIKQVKADWRKSEVEIKYEGAQPAADQVSEAIQRAGYKVGVPDRKHFFSGDRRDYQELGLAAVILVGLYFILKGLGLTSWNINTSSGLTVPVILLVGLAAGFSSCMALVGGLVLGISARHNELHPEATSTEKFQPHLFFNSGRLLSYVVLGGALGLLGSAFQLSSAALSLITIAVGIIMLITGLQLIEIFPWAQRLKLTLPKSFSRVLGQKQHQRSYSHNKSFALGALTFFLPCGFTQAMQVYAISTGSFFGGAVVMGAFALGTMPGLLGIGGLTSVVKGDFARKFFKIAGLAVIIFAFFNIRNGIGLSDWSWPSARSNQAAPTVSVGQDSNVTIENGVQIVKMRETNNGYEPNYFTIQKDLPVKWVIDAQAPYSCASSILMSQYNIRRNLKAGENIIEFTPTEIGRVKFSCSMGMYTGTFNVVNGSVSPASSKTKTPAALSASGGTCGSAGGGCAASGGGCGCGGGKTPQPAVSDSDLIKAEITQDASSREDIQVIKTVYSRDKYLDPAFFKVKAGLKVRLEIDVRDNGVGCGYEIAIQGLYDNAQALRAGVPIIMEFTADNPGSYPITCGMDMIRYGAITVE